MSSSSLNIIVGIPTFRRPKGLEQLLQSLAKQSLLPNYIVVADNEGEGGEGGKVVSELIKNYFPIKLVLVPVVERGLSVVRNVLLETGFHKLSADALIMIDDDQTADENWIAELIKMQKETGKPIVKSLVVPRFETEPQPAWTINLPMYYKSRKYNGPCPIVYASNGVLIMRGAHTLEQCFDTRFNFTGGEDEEYFMRLKRLGGTIFAFCQNSICYEHYPKERITVPWVLKRSFRVGAGHMRMLFLHPPKLSDLAYEVFKFAVSIFAAPLFALLFFWHPMLRVWFLSLFVNACGKIYGLLGNQTEGYRYTSESTKT